MVQTQHGRVAKAQFFSQVTNNCGARCILNQIVVHVDVETQRGSAVSTMTWTIGEVVPLKWLTFEAIQFAGVNMDCAKR